MRRISLSSALLSKLAKHVAVLVCLAIAVNATHRFVIGQMSIFLLVVFAALLHSARTQVTRWSSLDKPEAPVPSPSDSLRSLRTTRQLPDETPRERPPAIAEARVEGSLGASDPSSRGPP